MVALLASFLLREEALSGRRIAGLVLGFAGVALIFGQLAASGDGPLSVSGEGPLAASGDASVLGGALMLGTTLCYACGTVYARWARPGSSAAVILGQQVFSFLPALALWLHPIAAYAQPGSVWMVVVLLGVFASAVPLTLYLHLLRTTQAADAALISYLQPVWATLLGALLLGEVPAGYASSGAERWCSAAFGWRAAAAGARSTARSDERAEGDRGARLASSASVQPKTPCELSALSSAVSSVRRLLMEV